MPDDAKQLRQLFNEELHKLIEYRPNTFMLSHMEEQDQDGDGDEDFDDVRVARYVAGGMQKDKALNKVKRKPMGKKGRKDEIAAEAGSLSESIQHLTLPERRALHEGIRYRVLQEQNESDAVEIKKGNQTIFRKTAQGWKVALQLAVSQVLSLVKPESRDDVQKALEGAQMGQQVAIPSEFLVNQGTANDKTRGRLLLRKEQRGFVDPLPVDENIIGAFTGSAGGAYTTVPGTALTSTSGSHSIGNCTVETKDNSKQVTLKIPVPGGDMRNFDDVFGAGSGVAAAIVKSTGLEGPGDKPIKIPVKYAADKSFIGFLSQKFLGIRTGSLRFTRTYESGTATYELTVSVPNIKSFEEELKEFEARQG